MKKKFLLTLLPILALSSCGTMDVSLFNKTYKSGENEIFYNLDVTFQTHTKTFKEVLKEKITAGTVNWSDSGSATEAGELVSGGAFTQTSSYESVVGEMESRAKILFGNEYNNMSIVIGGFKDGQASGSITKGGQTKNVVYKPYDPNAGADATYLSIYDAADAKDYLGYVDGGVEGGGCFNGKWKCILLGYESNTNRTNYRFTFTDEPSVFYKICVYAKIAN